MKNSLFIKEGNSWDYTRVRDLPIRAGIFIPVTLHIRRFRTPVWSVNAPSSAIVLLDSGKGETVCILLILAGYLE